MAAALVKLQTKRCAEREREREKHTHTQATERKRETCNAGWLAWPRTGFEP